MLYKRKKRKNKKSKKKNRSFAELHWDTGRAVDMLHAAETVS